ncbi:unnamed protein product [Brassicogethes aeneus]|uniref:NADH dehydrogenase [ubiquinone] 1 beta subcomplex subunit 8, mitochondrial n=1 Tax=Brassicogethes aeneus TaxID=1431903 RepID=A0A9P0FIS6_BRAAE|nr:unnamed protein product [Brassicogethes aeneus]
MSSLLNCVRLSKEICKNNKVILLAVRHHWNKDYKPGPYPKSEEEMAAAAKKYGLTRSEYKPYPDDGQGAGDYPNMPLVSADSKDPFYPWDNPELKRNFNEPLHREFDLMREDRYDVSAKLRWPMWIYWAQFLGVMAGCFAVYALAERVKMFPAVIPRQYPSQGKIHYTFEQN